MAYSFNAFKAELQEVEGWLTREFAAIRTGRATPALLDGVMVDSYGSKMPLKQVGTVGVEDVRSLRVTLWDKSQVRAVEQAIQLANLGVSITVDGASIRIIFPDLTADKRKILIKLANEKAEEARISIRKVREKTWNDIQAKEREGEISEDDKFRLKDELQKMVDEANDKVKATLDRKETEISQ